MVDLLQPKIQTTIRAYLNHRNPILDLHIRRPQGERSSRLQTIAPAIPDNILPWDTLNLTYINKRFGDILDQPVSLPPFPILPTAQLYLDAETSFESILSAYNVTIVNHALKAASELLEWKALGTSTLPELVWLKGSYYILPELKPDWGGGSAKLPPANSRKFTNWLPGDTKYLSKPLKISLTTSPSFDALRRNADRVLAEEGSVEEESSSDREPHNLSSQPDPNHEQPSQYSVRAILEQGFGYASALNLPYFYIITPVELLCIRCFVDDPSTPGIRDTRSKVKKPIQTPHPRKKRKQVDGGKDNARDDNYVDNEKEMYAGIQITSLKWDCGEIRGEEGEERRKEHEKESGKKHEKEESGENGGKARGKARGKKRRKEQDKKGGRNLGEYGNRDLDAEDQAANGDGEHVSYNLGMWVLHILAACDRSARTLDQWREEDKGYLE